MNTKICKLCNIEKNPDDFYERQLKCKVCCIKKQKEWSIKNREKTRIYLKTFKEKNPETYKRHQRKYCEKNREMLNYKSGLWKKNNRKKWNNYIRKYKKENPSYRVSEQLRSRIRYALNGKTKCKSTETLLGCSFEQLKRHLESKFQLGMNWNNYGKWHIDHIKPCALFDLTDPSEQMECFNYRNLQPLWAKDNLKKHSSYTPIL